MKKVSRILFDAHRVNALTLSLALLLTPAIHAASCPGQVQGVLHADGALPDIEDVIAAQSARRADNVFFQLEAEGIVGHADIRESGGSFFKYYMPVELREDLLRKLHASMSKSERAGYKTRLFFVRDKWRALKEKHKLDYLKLHEEAVTAERGPGAAWGGTNKKTFLLMKKTDRAPDFVADHPDFEIYAFRDNPKYARLPGGHFSLPEITTHRNRPAATIHDAISRAQSIAVDTGHSSIHVHVFMKIPRERLLAREEELKAMLSLANERTYLRACSRSLANFSNPVLQPWHAGREAALKKLLSGSPLRPDDPAVFELKFMTVGLRVWEHTPGHSVISFELRATANPFKTADGSNASVTVKELAAGEKQARDYSQTQRSLALLRTFAERLTDVRPLPPRAFTGARTIMPDIAKAETAFGGQIQDVMRLMDGATPAMAGKFINSAGAAHPGLLLPFMEIAAGNPSQATHNFIKSFKRTAQDIRAAAAKGPHVLTDRAQTLKYELELAYREWARYRAAEADQKLERAVRILAGGG